MLQIKEFLQYIFDIFKIWVIIQPWESGLRVRVGKRVKKLTPGIHFKIPYFDSIYIQQKKLRVCEVPIQTCTTKDGKNITLKASLGYSIKDVQKLYNTLYHPENSIINIATGEVSEKIYQLNSEDIKPSEIEYKVLEKLREYDYGIDFEYFKINNFAIARTYRLIQDQGFQWEGLDMDNKK